MSAARRYVLCASYPDGWALVGGDDPAAPGLHADPARARTFPSPQEASAYRRRLAPQPGGAYPYRVYELTAVGGLIPA
jgi:hypothetical protein